MKAIILILALLSVEAMAARDRSGNRNNRNSMNNTSRSGMRNHNFNRPSRPVVRPRPHRPTRPFVRPGRRYGWHPVRNISRSVLRSRAYSRYNRYGWGNDCMDRATGRFSYREARQICKYVWSDSCFYELDQFMSIRKAADLCEGVDERCFNNRLRFVGPRKAARQCN
jgi:hypothetical protein